MHGTLVEARFVEARRGGPRRRARRTSLAAAALVVVLAAAGCGAFSDPAEEASTVSVDRGDAHQEGDVEGNVGDELEVHDFVAVVTSTERVAEFSEIDTRGYIVATVRMDNDTGSSIDFNRSDWKLEKPDGTLSNTVNVSNQTQLQDDTIPGGESVEGTVIFNAGDLEGQFAIVFDPAAFNSDDSLERERGVWVFESAPGDAS